MKIKKLHYITILLFLFYSLSLFAYDGPLIDGHLHFSKNSDLNLIKEKFKSNNILKAIIFPREFKSGDDYGISEGQVLNVIKANPEIGWLLLGLQKEDLHNGKRVDYWNAPDSKWKSWLSYAEQELLSGRRKGMGELIVRHYDYHGKGRGEVDFPINSEVFLDLLSLSNKTNRPLVIHAEGELHVTNALLSALPKYPNAKIVWAHGCGRSNPDLINEWFKSHINLYCDLGNMTDTGNYGSLWPRAGTWTYQVEKNGVIDPKWLVIMNSYPDRLYIGSDVNEAKGWNKSWQIRIDRFRKLLSQINPEARELIAYKTAMKLYDW
jgi:hypothetical protein